MPLFPRLPRLSTIIFDFSVVWEKEAQVKKISNEKRKVLGALDVGLREDKAGI